MAIGMIACVPSFQSRTCCQRRRRGYASADGSLLMAVLTSVIYNYSIRTVSGYEKLFLAHKNRESCVKFRGGYRQQPPISVPHLRRNLHVPFDTGCEDPPPALENMPGRKQLARLATENSYTQDIHGIYIRSWEISFRGPKVTAIGDREDGAAATVKPSTGDGVSPPRQTDGIVANREEHDERRDGDTGRERGGQDVVVLFPPGQAVPRQPVHEDKTEDEPGSLIG